MAFPRDIAASTGLAVVGAVVGFAVAVAVEPGSCITSCMSLLNISRDTRGAPDGPGNGGTAAACVDWAPVGLT